MNDRAAQLPSFLHRTPEQVRDENARQAILRDLHLKGAKQTPAEMKIGQAILAEKAIRANLELIDKDTDVYRETMLQLAEVLAEQGKFHEAAGVAGDDTHYQKLADAVDRDDAEVCNCTPETVPVQSRNVRGEPVTKEIEIPKTFIAAEVFSEKHGKIVPLVQCAICGFSNAKESHDDRNNLSDVEKQ